MRQVAVVTGLRSVQDLLRTTYGPVEIDPLSRRRGLRIERARLGPVEFHDVKVAMDFDAAVSAQEMLIFGELTSGRLRRGFEEGEHHYLPGDVFLAAQPGRPHTSTVHGAEARLIIVDPALIGQVADSAPGRSPAPVRFTGYDAVSPQARLQWIAACRYVRDHVLADAEETAGPLVAASAARLLVATALATFPNNALTDPTIEDRHDGSPATLRRAIAFIDSHAHQDVSLADIAAAAGVSIRAVQLAFRRHLATTPTRYLRRVRLDHAHRQLVAADPEFESVTAVSYQWGFASSSRFAAYYRTVYGVSPSSTLHAR